jgi:LmbE family N-acetylglucosaminyl deacetylase
VPGTTEDSDIAALLDLTGHSSTRRRVRVLCIGAHCDDIEIGCAGALQVMQARRGGLLVDWVVLSAPPERRAETERAMALLVPPAYRGGLRWADFVDGLFPAHYGEIKKFFESLKRSSRPDVIFCHERDDRHQDHRLLNEMVWNTFRDHLVLEYEVPKWDGGLGQPNLYVPLSQAQAHKKIDTLMKVYATQKSRDWFTPDTFQAMLRLRGLECRSPSGLAEAFHARKVRLAGI